MALPVFMYTSWVLYERSMFFFFFSFSFIAVYGSMDLSAYLAAVNVGAKRLISCLAYGDKQQKRLIGGRASGDENAEGS